MELKTILKRYPVFILGLYFLSLGIVLIVRSALGTTPISSINYVLSINSALSLGTWTFLFNLLLIAGQFWLIRDRYSRRDILEILLQIPFSFLFAAFIDFNMMFTGQLHPGSYGLSVALLLPIVGEPDKFHSLHKPIPTFDIFCNINKPDKFLD